jgi:hypothetical protein
MLQASTQRIGGSLVEPRAYGIESGLHIIVIIDHGRLHAYSIRRDARVRPWDASVEQMHALQPIHGLPIQSAQETSIALGCTGTS